MRDPRDIEGCEILLDPQRKSTQPAIVEGFLGMRLDENQIRQIGRAVTGSPA